MTRHNELAHRVKKVHPGTAAAVEELARRWDECVNVEKLFGQVVKDERLRRRWSQEELANALSYRGVDMHQTTVTKIERGTRPLRVAEAVALCSVLGLDLPAALKVLIPQALSGLRLL